GSLPALEGLSNLSQAPAPSRSVFQLPKMSGPVVRSGTTMAKRSPAPFITDDSAAAFNHFSALIPEFQQETVEICNADPEIVRVNLTRAVDAVRPHLDKVQEDLPKVQMHELLELPSFALALGYAANKVFVPASSQEIKTCQARQR